METEKGQRLIVGGASGRVEKIETVEELGRDGGRTLRRRVTLIWAADDKGEVTSGGGK